MFMASQGCMNIPPFVVLRHVAFATHWHMKSKASKAKQSKAKKSVAQQVQEATRRLM
jgi:hypothetical protein